MIDPNDVPDIASDETHARYIFSSGYVRGDNSVKGDAFLPPPDLQMSVNRHLLSNETEIWFIGERIAVARNKSLRGRADIGTKACRDQSLDVVAAPIDGNPNHAHVVSWPSDKPARKLIAQEIAATARFLPRP